MSSSLQYSGLTQAMERYEYTTAMLVKVVRIEYTNHAEFMRFKQDFMALCFE